MYRYVITFIVLFSAFGCIAQTDLDSLLSEYENQKTVKPHYSWQLATKLGESRDLAFSDRIIYTKEAIEIAKQMDSARLVIQNLNSLARLYWQLGDSEKSIQVLYEMGSEAKANSDIYWEASAYTNIANTLKTRNEFIEALSLEKKALPLFESLKDTLLIFSVLSNIADSYYQMKQYDSAKYFVNLSQEYYVSKGHLSYDYVNAFVQVVEALLMARDMRYDSAILLMNASFSSLDGYQVEQSIALWNIELSEIFLSHGLMDRAIQFASKGFETGKRGNYKEAIRDGSEVLAKAYEQQNNLTQSLTYSKLYHAYKDSIVNIENVKRIAALKADFEIDQKQAEVDLANQQKQNRQYLAIGLGAFLVLSIVFLINVNRQSQKRRKLNDQLAELNTTKDKFFSILSHDLRGPVSAFSGIGDLIDYYLKEESYDQLKVVSSEINKSAKSVTDLLDNLLNWAVQQQGHVPFKPSAVDIKELVDQTLGIFEASASAKEISLHNEIESKMAAFVDKDTAMTIFRNLVGNALKFTEKGGTIRVTAKKENQNIIVSVIDNGVGMSGDQIANLFSHKNSRKYGTSGERGLGLGLQLVQEFVELNNGSVCVESEVGAGSTFIVTIPLQEANQAVSG